MKLSADTYLTRAEPAAWELFHENSKTGRFDRGLSNAQVASRMRDSWQSLPYDNFRAFELPPRRRLEMTLDDAIATRVTARAFELRTLPFEDLATLLFCAYGVTRDAQEGLFPRPFR